MKITEPYRIEREIKHLDPEYGCERSAHAPLVSQMVDRLGVTELLDYWCGKAWLAKNLKAAHQVKIQCYDPAVPGFAGDAIPMQMVACCDVLQDVEPECLDAVLDDLERVTSVVGYFSILDSKDGKITESLAWWLEKIMARFDLHTLQRTPAGFYVIVYAKPKPMIETLQ